MNRARVILVRSAILVAALLLVATGCGKKPVGSTVSGKLSYKGEVLGGGSLQFHPAGGAPLTATITPEGTYTCSGIPSGSVKVTVETETIKSLAGGTPYKANPKGPQPPKNLEKGGPSGLNDTRKYVKIPEKYAKVATTTLTAEISGSKQELNFDLTD